jgi:hypothetical protein
LSMAVTQLIWYYKGFREVNQAYFYEDMHLSITRD